MSEIRFEEEKIYAPQVHAEAPSMLTALAMKLGAKTFAQAQMVLLGVSILVFILAIIVIYSHFFRGKNDEQTPITPVGDILSEDITDIEHQNNESIKSNSLPLSP